MRILFMGTPDFAVSSLAALYESGKFSLTVVTQPDRPKGRGYALTPPSVKVWAAGHNLPVFQPQTLRDGAFEAFLKDCDPEMIVVAAYGKILPKFVLDYPKYGCINIHGSLLPAYRGAAPIQRALLDGKSETGITVMVMDEGLDTGDILYRMPVAIDLADNAETLFDKMAKAGAEALMKILPAILDGSAKREKQNPALATYAKKIEKSDCEVDFNRPAWEVYNQIRGLSPFPLAFVTRGGAGLKLIAASLSETVSDLAPGSVVGVGKEITVVCGDGKCVAIRELLPAGKKRMSASDYTNGNRLTAGERLADRRPEDSAPADGKRPEETVVHDHVVHDHAQPDAAQPDGRRPKEG